MDKFIKFTCGLIFGAVVGAAAAFLFAPASGGDTRKAIVDKAEEIKSEYNRGTEERKRELENEVMVLRGEKPSAN